MDKEEINHVSKTENSRMRSKQTRYNNKTFSKSRHCWYHDFFINNGASKPDEPKYYHVFINVNTKYGVAIGCNSRSADAVENTIKRFVRAHACKKLVSDAERSFISSRVISYLKGEGIDVQINDEQNHKTLGVVDRFIRTIRDKWGSNKPIPDASMKKIINAYNHTEHAATWMTPAEMEDDKEKEIGYIVRMIHKQYGVEKQPDYKLEHGDFVRLIKPIQLMTKKRRTLTKHYYIVDSTDLNRVVVMAADGSTQSVSRSDCVKINKNTGLSLAAKIGGGNRGTIKKIVSFDGKDTYKCQFYKPDGSIDRKLYNVSVSDLRAQFPNRISQLEREFFDEQGKKNKHE